MHERLFTVIVIQHHLDILLTLFTLFRSLFYNCIWQLQPGFLGRVTNIRTCNKTFSLSLSFKTPEKKSNDQRTRKRKGDPFDSQGKTFTCILQCLMVYFLFQCERYISSVYHVVKQFRVLTLSSVDLIYLTIKCLTCDYVSGKGGGRGHKISDYFEVGSVHRVNIHFLI